MRWTRYAGWANIVLGVVLGIGFAPLGLAPVGVILFVTLTGSGVFMVWLASGWDKPVEDLNELHKYGRPANATVLSAGEPVLDATGRRTAKLKLNVAPVNESDFITTRTLELPGGRVPAVGETVTVKFDPQQRKNVILLEQAFMVEDHLTAANRMFSGGGATLAVAALATLAFAAPAGAAVTQMSSGVPVGELELAGQSVVFGSFGTSTTRVMRADPGGALTQLAEYTSGGGDDDECCSTYVQTGFSASDRQVALSRFYEAYVKGTLAQSDYSLRAGPVQGELGLLFICAGNHPYDVDGDRIAYLGDDCTEKTTGMGARVVVRNLAAQGAPVVASFPMTEQPNTLDLAGDHVALAGFFSKAAELRVYDLGTSSVAYKVDHNFAQFALQADGKVAVAHPTAQGECRIEWFSRAEPVAHRIPVCPRGRVRMAGDRIAVDRLDGSGSALDVVSLNGDRRSVTFFEPAGSLTGFDWDGSRLGYGVQGCARVDDAVFVEDLTSDPPVVEGTPCIASIDTKTARSDRKGLVRLRVSCIEGCTAELNLFAGKFMVNTRPSRLVVPAGTGARSVPVRLQSTKPLRRRGGRLYQARIVVNQRGTGVRTFKAPVRVLAPKG